MKKALTIGEYSRRAEHTFRDADRVYIQMQSVVLDERLPIPEFLERVRETPFCRSGNYCPRCSYKEMCRR